MTASCSLCGACASTPYLAGTDRLLRSSREHTIVRCCTCGFRFLSPRPPFHGLAAHYPPEYPPHRYRLSRLSDKAMQGAFSRFKWHMDSWNLQRIGYSLSRLPSPGWVARRLAPLRRGKLQRTILPPHGGCRMLDVGCGTGHLMYRHEDLGWKTWGVEMSAQAAEAARQAGLRVITGQVESADLPRGYFDLIVMMHVLEHVEDPVVVLGHIRPLLAPGGQVLIEVPNADSWGLCFWGTYWFPLELPRHLSHFGRDDLTRLATKTGYRVIRSLTRREGQWHASSLDYWLRDRSSLPSFLRAADLASRFRLHRWFLPLLALLARGDAGDALRVWLEPVR